MKATTAVGLLNYRIRRRGCLPNPKIEEAPNPSELVQCSPQSDEGKPVPWSWNNRPPPPPLTGLEGLRARETDLRVTFCPVFRVPKRCPRHLRHKVLSAPAMA